MKKDDNNGFSTIDGLPEFDFEYWRSLHQNSPELFEQEREEWLTKLINDAPVNYRKRLSGIKFHIDTIRSTEKNPLQTCVKLSSMMMDSINDVRMFLDELGQIMKGRPSDEELNKTTAKVLQFVRD
jgi:uncharacterized protein DUF3135